MDTENKNVEGLEPFDERRLVLTSLPEAARENRMIMKAVKKSKLLDSMNWFLSLLQNEQSKDNPTNTTLMKRTDDYGSICYTITVREKVYKLVKNFKHFLAFFKAFEELMTRDDNRFYRAMINSGVIPDKIMGNAIWKKDDISDKGLSLNNTVYWTPVAAGLVKHAGLSKEQPSIEWCLHMDMILTSHEKGEYCKKNLHHFIHEYESMSIMH
jgi:hypothetical protein